MEICCRRYLQRLPKGKQLTIQTPFDGKVILLKNNKILEIRHIVAEEILTVDDLSFGCEVRIFQSCDIVRSIRFEKSKENKNYADFDQEMIQKLNNCNGPAMAVPHSVGVIAKSLSNFPQSKKWLYRMIRKGNVPVDAFKLMVSYQNRKKGAVKHD